VQNLDQLIWLKSFVTRHYVSNIFNKQAKEKVNAYIEFVPSTIVINLVCRLLLMVSFEEAGSDGEPPTSSPEFNVPGSEQKKNVREIGLAQKPSSNPVISHLAPSIASKIDSNIQKQLLELTLNKESDQIDRLAHLSPPNTTHLTN